MLSSGSGTVSRKRARNPNVVRPHILNLSQITTDEQGHIQLDFTICGQ